MGEKLHFWSDMPGDWHISAQRHAEKHAEREHGTTTRIDSIEKLKNVFRAMSNFKLTSAQLDFHTHGRPGRIRLGADRLTCDNIFIHLGNQGFDKLFSKDAAIIFAGCSVGEGFRGEYFLARAGAILLP